MLEPAIFFSMTPFPGKIIDEKVMENGWSSIVCADSLDNVGGEN